VHGANSSVPPVSSDVLKGLNKEFRATSPDERPKYLAVVSDINMLTYLSEYSSVDDYGYEHVLPFAITAAELSTKEPSRLRIFHKNCQQTVVPSSLYPVLLGFRNIQSVYVAHCHGAKAVTLTFLKPSNSPSGSSSLPLKVSYSGDCRPSKEFAVIGANSTVLIHEATFEDELVGEARAKKHSTVSEALGVGSLMRAQSVILTHFSQRYSKIPVLEGFWGDRSKVEAAIKGSNEVQERLGGIETFEDEVQAGDEEEVLADGGNVLPEAEEEEQDQDEVMEEEIQPTIEDTSTQEEDSSLKQLDNMKVVVAFDYMRVKLRDIPKMEGLRPALAKLFEDDIGTETSRLNMLARAEKRERERSAGGKEGKEFSMGRQDKQRGRNSPAGKKFAEVEERRAKE
jgi:ribonuclease Z